ncbi:flagellar assembly protein FliW [Propionivibrio sp.]|uniref:flagellar assembly protein FliW n=1 Tax=Propionivibrio sp. TaxID=2212460 RepID=UPI003BF195C0
MEGGHRAETGAEVAQAFPAGAQQEGGYRRLLQDTEDAAVAVIVYRDDAESGKIAANTRSPVILNLKSRKGMQKVLQEVHPTLLYRAR